jgi:hypothetical protein
MRSRCFITEATIQYTMARIGISSAKVFQG